MTPSADPKAMARALRSALEARGVPLTHSEALEIVAHQHGARDWNTFVATRGSGEPAEASSPPTDDVGVLEAIPILSVFDADKALAFYRDYLGFTVDWEDRAGDHRPRYLQVSRGLVRLHLSEHHGDATPGAAVRLLTGQLSRLQGELTTRDYSFADPSVVEEKASLTLTVIDPFGNRIVFEQPTRAGTGRDEETGATVPGRLPDLAGPIRHTLHVRCDPDRAFAVFTGRIGEWWDPRYSSGASSLTGIEIEPRVGGRALMLHRDREPFVWGTVTVWDPPRTYEQTFNLALDPDYPSTIRADFSPEGDGRCRVEFAHGGWTAGNLSMRGHFSDWPHLLAGFVTLAESG